MNYHKILKYDTANGPGIRTTIWFTGCCFRCPDCFNSEIQDFNTGKPFDDNAKEELFSYLNDPHVTGLSILGGEPLIQDYALTKLLQEVKIKFPDKSIWMWTGFKLKKLLDATDHNINDNYISSQEKLNVISYVDYLVDGPYMKDETKYHTRFRGSSNQIIWHILPIVPEDEPNKKGFMYMTINESYAFDNHLENNISNLELKDTLLFNITETHP